MKTIVVETFGGPEVMKLVEVADPIVGPAQVVVALKAIGVNPKDTHYRQGLYPALKSPPFTPGIDGAGVIEAIGEDVNGFAVGQRVYVSGSLTGTYAQKVLCHVYQVHPLPDTITFSQGAGIGVPYGTASRALFQQAQAKQGETILIHGANGGVGLAALQLLRGGSFVVIGTAGTEEGLNLVKKEGADFVFCHRDPNYIEQIIKEVGDRKIDVILEMQAHLNLNKDLRLLAKQGRVVVIGSANTVEFNPQHLKDFELSILAVSLLVAPHEDLVHMHEVLQISLKKGLITPLISAEFPLQDAPHAHQLIAQPGQKGKIVLIP